jgi:hypothetical protein
MTADPLTITEDAPLDEIVRYEGSSTSFCHTNP